MKILKCQNINVEYSGISILKNLNFEMNREEIVLIQGDNGSGKTTFLNCITGFEPKHQGEIFFLDKRLSSLSTYARLRTGISFMPQGSFLINSLTVQENLELSRQILKGKFFDSSEFIQTVMNISLIEKNKSKMVKILSKGERRKIEFFLSVYRNAELYIFDEPSSGWDLESKQQLIDLFIILKKFGKSILFIEHEFYYEETHRQIDRILTLKNGNFV